MGVRDRSGADTVRDGGVRAVDLDPLWYRRASKLRRMALLKTLCSCDGVLPKDVADVLKEACDCAVVAVEVTVY